MMIGPTVFVFRWCAKAANDLVWRPVRQANRDKQKRCKAYISVALYMDQYGRQAKSLVVGWLARLGIARCLH